MTLSIQAVHHTHLTRTSRRTRRAVALVRQTPGRAPRILLMLPRERWRHA